jgi:hypothetical protein
MKEHRVETRGAGSYIISFVKLGRCLEIPESRETKKPFLSRDLGRLETFSLSSAWVLLDVLVLSCVSWSVIETVVS